MDALTWGRLDPRVIYSDTAINLSLSGLGGGGNPFLTIQMDKTLCKVSQ